MELLIKYLKNWWSDSVIPTIETLIRKNRENTDDIISAVENITLDTQPVVTVDFSSLVGQIERLEKVLTEKDMTVNVEGTTVEMQPVTVELKGLLKGLKAIEKKIPKVEKQKFIDYTDKLDKLIEISKQDDTEIKKLQEITQSLNTSDDLSALAEWLKVIAEKEYPEVTLPLDKDGRIKVAVDKVGGGGGGLTQIETGYLATTASKQDEIIDAIENITVTSESAPSKPTDAYGYCASSATSTHEYAFFEDKDGNWYIMRETLATEVVDYTKGTGGYDSVYVDKDSAPSGTLTWASYSNTF